MIGFLIWWVIGIATYIIGCIVLDKELTPKNLFEASYIGLLGPILTILTIILFFKDYKMPDEWKEFFNEDLLNKKDK
jgi:hypothetical protein